MISRNPCTLIDPPQPEEPEAETLTASRPAPSSRLTADRRNGTRWSVALALGLRQRGAGLRRAYVDLDRAVLYADWQIKRDRYRHGCRTRMRAASGGTPTRALRIARKLSDPGRRHVCRKRARAGCTEHGGKCPKFCPPGCARHGKACPDRKGGWQFARPKGKRREPYRSLCRSSRSCASTSRARTPRGRPPGPMAGMGPRMVPAERAADRPSRGLGGVEGAPRRSGNHKVRRLHDARHTSGTFLGEQHVDLHVIQRILGHAQVSTTRIYTDPTDPLTREAVGLIGRALWPDTD